MLDENNRDIARRAWLAMVNKESPMPVDIAVDMVQDVVGDRRDAVNVTMEYGVEWIVSPLPIYKYSSQTEHIALKIVSYIRNKKWSEAVGLINELYLLVTTRSLLSCPEQPLYENWARDAWKTTSLSIVLDELRIP